MKVAFKSLIAAAAFMSVGLASAATVTVVAGQTAYKGKTVSGTETLTLSPRAVSALNVFKSVLGSEGPAQTTATVDTTGKFNAVIHTAPLATLGVDDVTDEVQATTGAGALTWQVPVSPAANLGGSVSLADLEVNLVDKKVYATLNGANGVGVLPRVALWDVASVSGTASLAPPADGSASQTFTASGLVLTPEARALLVKSLGLNNLGTAALAAIGDSGTLAVTTTLAQAPLTACSVTFQTTPAGANAPYFTTAVTVRNFTSNPATGWQVDWTHGQPTLATAVKNARLTHKGLRAYTARPLSSNVTVEAGGSTTFSFRGYSANRASAVSEASATLGGVTCPVMLP